MLEFGEMLNNKLNGRVIEIKSYGFIDIGYWKDGDETVGNYIWIN